LASGLTLTLFRQLDWPRLSEVRFLFWTLFWSLIYCLFRGVQIFPAILQFFFFYHPDVAAFYKEEFISEMRTKHIQMEKLNAKLASLVSLTQRLESTFFSLNVPLTNGIDLKFLVYCNPFFYLF
jgi:hypothetical protein